MKAMVTTGALVGAFLAAMGDASAAPTIFPRTGNRLSEVKNPTTSTILADSHDPNTLYVMPPPVAKASLANVVYGANIGFCAEMRDLQVYSRNLAQRYSNASVEIDSYKVEIDALRKEKGEYDEQAEAIKKSSTAVREADDLSDRIEALELRIDELRDRRNACEDVDTTCRDEIREEIDTLKNEKKDLSKELSEKRRAAGDAMRDYDRLKGKADAVQRQIDDVFGLVFKKMEFVVKAKNQIMEMYANLAKIEGGHASVNFDTGWSANVKLVQSANAGFNVAPIQTQNVRAAVALVPGLGSDSYLESLPAILDMVVGGRPIDPKNPFQELPAVPETVTATVRLSLVGACVQKSPADFDIDKDQQGLPVYGLAETYLYPSTFLTKVTAKANTWKAYSYLKKVITKGGFFSSSTRTEVSEESTGDSFVTIETFDESGLSRDEVTALEDTIKLEVLQDVLRMMGIPQPSGAGGEINVISPPPSGAVVLAQGADRTCGWFSFACPGVSWVLLGLNAIFGSSEAEAEFKTRYDYWAKRSYERDAVSLRPGMVSFKR